MTRRLGRLRYAEVPKPPLLPGQYALSPKRITVSVNDRETAWGRTPGVAAVLEFSGRRVASVRRAEDGSPLPHVVFEPEVVGTVFDEKMQDRTLVTLDQVPKVLLDAILTTEDRDFFTHAGISPRRLVGAVLQSVTRRAGVRGTSTLTQQLVKNMFLTPERTLKRKAVEALMAVILESKYSKTQILEAYLNEIYLGQRGSVSVTGRRGGVALLLRQGRLAARAQRGRDARRPHLVAGQVLAVPQPRQRAPAARGRPEGNARAEEDRQGRVRRRERGAAHAGSRRPRRESSRRTSWTSS